MISAWFSLLITVLNDASGLTPHRHLFSADTISSPGIETMYALDIQSATSTDGRRADQVWAVHNLTVTFWRRIPTQGAEPSTWTTCFDTEQAIIAAIQERRSEWHSLWTGTSRRLSSNGELWRIDVRFTLKAPFNSVS